MNITNTNAPIIVGVDHGFGNMKTAHACFRTGVSSYDKEPTFKSNLLTYENRYYVVGEEYKEFWSEKASDNDNYILTLAAIARELDVCGLTSARVHIAAGLPLTWVTEQTDAFWEYLLQNPSADFTFRGIADIGNGTMNLMYVIDCRPQVKKCYTEKYGTNQCALAVRENLMCLCRAAVDESAIECVFRNGAATISERYLKVIRDTATEYVR